MEQPFALPVRRGNFMPIVRELDSFTLGTVHIGVWVKLDKGTAAVVTMPALDTTEDAEGIIEWYGVGSVTLAPGNGATIRCDGYASTLVLHARYATAVWKWDAALREYNVSGYVTTT